MRLKIMVGIILLLVLVYGCTANSPTEAILSPDTALTPEETPLQPTSPIDRTTPEPSVTPIVLFEEEIQAYIETNGGCELPCWWGITPGMTLWDDATLYLDRFATITKISGPTRRTEKGDNFFETNYGVEMEGELNAGAAIFTIAKNNIIQIETYPASTQFIAQLHQLLGDYETPEQIYVITYDNSPGSYIPFSLVLYYQSQRFFAWYKYESQRVGEVIRACPSAGGALLILYSERVEFSLEEIAAEVLGPDPSVHLRELEEVTDYSIESFSHTFADPSYSTCIETPVEHWE